MDTREDRAGRPAARRRHGRVSASDVLLAVGALVVMIVGSRFHGIATGSAPGPLAYTLMVVSAAALVVRDRWPRTVLGVTAAAAVVYVATGQDLGPFFLAFAIAMYTLAARSRLSVTLPAAGIGIVLLATSHLPDVLAGGWSQASITLTDTLLWPVFWSGLPAAAGSIARLVQEERRHTREEANRQVAYEERLRVAREVHDVVGHGLAVINMQAGIALHVIGKRPDQAEVALEAIKTTSKDALEELRGTLAVFRQPDGTAPRRPAAGLEQLQTLVKEMGDSGLPVELEVTGERTAVPGAVNLAAYRIVQESLTNVLRHAGRATATVRVGYEPDAVALEIVDDGRGRNGHGHTDLTAGGGHGISGMRERAAALGGTFEAGPRPGGGFRVRAWLPVGTGPPDRA